jgi:hypothetical protein
MVSPTPDARTEFLKKVSELVDFWHRDARVVSGVERLEGLAFSMLYLIGGHPEGALRLVKEGEDITEGIHERWGELRYREAA